MLKEGNLKVNNSKTENFIKPQRHQNDPNWRKCKLWGSIIDTSEDIKRRKSLLLEHMKVKKTIPASREMLDRRWSNVVTYVGATPANDVGPTCICPSVQRWHNVVTPPTMTLCQSFANVITYCLSLYLMVGTTFAHCLYEWLAKHWHNFIIAHCLSMITIKITSFIWKAVA